MTYVAASDLEQGLEQVRAAPRRMGTLEMIVARPAEGERTLLDRGELSVDEGLVGDDWRARFGPDATPDPATQITVMNARYADLVAGGRDRWALAGDQLYVDLDLSVDHLPVGSRLAVGSAVIEVSAQPHTGCSKFSARFGVDALRLAGSKEGRALRLRGMYASVVQAGVIEPGDTVALLAPE